MSALRLSLHFTLFIMLFLSIACGSTKFTALWKDATYQGHPEKILVINVFPNPANRRLFEDEFVKQLKDHGIDAVISYSSMPDPIVSDKEAIAAQAKEVGADTVLINSPLGRSEDVYIGAGAAQYLDVYIKTQTDVIDMRSNRLILTASAETWVNQDKPYIKQIQSYVKDLVKKLSKAGLF